MGRRWLWIGKDREVVGVALCRHVRGILALFAFLCLCGVLSVMGLSGGVWCRVRGSVRVRGGALWVWPRVCVGC